uniref:Uncharacterized protein n=1 Tax=Leersia perrieri TaxID=77586 RepID=A0A0D9VYM3_9ORYZ
MAPAVVPVEDGGGGVVEEKRTASRSCHVTWLAWWDHLRCLISSTLLPCSTTTASSSSAAVVRGTLFLPTTGVDRRVRLFLHSQSHPTTSPEHHNPPPILVLDLPVTLTGADIAATGRIVLESQRQWITTTNGGELLGSPEWLVYCNGRRAGFAARRERPTEAEGWVLEKLWAVSAGAGRLAGGAGAGVEYLRGRFERVVASSDAESFHLVDPIGWLGFNGSDGGLSIFFHRI